MSHQSRHLTSHRCQVWDLHSWSLISLIFLKMPDTRHCIVPLPLYQDQRTKLTSPNIFLPGLSCIRWDLPSWILITHDPFSQYQTPDHVGTLVMSSPARISCRDTAELFPNPQIQTVTSSNICLPFSQDLGIEKSPFLTSLSILFPKPCG